MCFSFSVASQDCTTFSNPGSRISLHQSPVKCQTAVAAWFEKSDPRARSVSMFCVRTHAAARVTCATILCCNAFRSALVRLFLGIVRLFTAAHQVGDPACVLPAGEHALDDDGHRHGQNGADGPQYPAPYDQGYECHGGRDVDAFLDELGFYDIVNQEVDNDIEPDNDQGRLPAKLYQGLDRPGDDLDDKADAG